MTDVATPDAPGAIESVQDRMARFNALFSEDQPELTPEEVQMQIVEQILAQSTVEDILGGRDTVGSKDYVDTPFTLLGLDVRDSTIEGDGPNRYMLLRCVDADGERFAMTSGSINIMAAAWNLNDRGHLPVRCVVKRATKPSAAGFYPLWLEAAPDA